MTIKKKILIINRGTCSNVGDQEINHVFAKFLNSNFDVHIETVDYTSRLNSPIRLNKILRSRKIKSVLKKFISPQLVWLKNYNWVKYKLSTEKPDLLVIGGGELLMPGVFCIAAYIWILAATKLKIPVVMSNIGCRGRFTFIDRWLLKEIDKKVCGILFRDTESYKNYLEINLRADHLKLRIGTDIVYADGDYKPNNFAEYAYAICIIDKKVYEKHNNKISDFEYYEKWIKFLSDKKIFSAEKNILVYATAEDYEESIKFQKHVKRYYGFKFELANISNREDFKKILYNCENVVSSRMHTLIIALLMQKTILVHSLSDKLRRFEKDTDHAGIKQLIDLSRNTTYNFIYDHLHKGKRLL